MSKATEIAEAEAAAAEAEHPDDDDDAGDGADTAAEPDADDEDEGAEPDEDEATDDPGSPDSAPSSLAQVERMRKAVDAEERRHEKALRRALGETFDGYVECPLCQLSGYGFPHDPADVPDEQRAAVLAMLGESQRPDYKTSQAHVMCSDCDGWGEVISGSKRLGNELTACTRCMGLGYIDKPYEAPPPPAAIFPPITTPAPNGQGGPQYGPDPWGRAWGDPYYGVLPSTVGTP